MLIGGRLLNRNLDFIDTMNDLVYRETGADTGTARAGTTTLFLDDVRISTNVRLFEGNRALGTRVSEVVWQQVMGQGRTWLDRAFVVNAWYISGYLPITDLRGERIGMLYTGFLERPFTQQRNAMLLGLTLAFLVVIILTVPTFLRLARGVFKPLERMTATMSRVEAGALDARIGRVEARDEIGAVARHLDRLLDQVQERDDALREYAGNLNEQVEKRTEELREANRRLEATYAQLVVSEKLASIGEITAGVAHEINNPVAVIQGNLEVLRMEVGDGAADHATELDLIEAQIHRINVIVGKLLDFARNDEASEGVQPCDAAQLVDDTLVLVAPDLRKQGITVETRHADAPGFVGRVTEIEQVLVNLTINAAQSMRAGGTITMTTGPAAHEGKDGVEITVTDTGCGIEPGRIGQVFDPFFTTKPGEGTGLGLSISRTLIDRAGGEHRGREHAGRGHAVSNLVARRRVIRGAYRGRLQGLVVRAGLKCFAAATIFRCGTIRPRPDPAAIAKWTKFPASGAKGTENWTF